MCFGYAFVSKVVAFDVRCTTEIGFLDPPTINGLI